MKITDWLRGKNHLLTVLYSTIFLLCLLFFLPLIFPALKSYLLDHVFIISRVHQNYSYDYVKFAEQVLTTFSNLLNRIFPLYVWTILCFAELIIFLIVTYQNDRYPQPVIKIERLASYLIISVLLISSGMQWLILFLRLDFLRDFPKWFWNFYIKPSMHDILFPLIALLCLGVVFWIYKKLWKTHLLTSIALIMIMGFGLQIGFGWIEEAGIKTLATNYRRYGHHHYAALSCEYADMPVIDILRDYSSFAFITPFFDTKPPGTVASFFLLEDLVHGSNPPPSYKACFTNLTGIIAVLFPLISILVIPLIYLLAEPLIGRRKALMACILYVLFPNFILITLELDQVIHPLLMMICLLAVSCTIRKQSIYWGAASGLLLYLVCFYTFTMLPLMGLIGLWLLFYWLINHRFCTWKIFFQLSASIAVGFLLGFGLLMVLFDYDPIQRYTTAMAAHREIKSFSEGMTLKQILLLNNGEFAHWIGFPAAVLFLAAFGRKMVYWAKKRFHPLLPMLLAFAGTYILLNLIGQTNGEVGRLWIFLLPLIAIFNADELPELFENESIGWLLIPALQLMTTFMIFKFQFRP